MTLKEKWKFKNYFRWVFGESLFTVPPLSEGTDGFSHGRRTDPLLPLALLSPK